MDAYPANLEAITEQFYNLQTVEPETRIRLLTDMRTEMELMANKTAIWALLRASARVKTSFLSKVSVSTTDNIENVLV